MAAQQNTSQPGSVQSSPVPQKKSRLGFSNKTLWDWISVLLVPVMIGLGTIWVTYQQVAISEAQHKNNQEIAQENRRQDLEIAQQNRRQDFWIEGNRVRAEILKTYMDDITDLYLHEGLSSSKEGDKVREIATKKTFLALEQLNEYREDLYGPDGVRKGQLVLFIYQLGLIDTKDTFIHLESADLEGAYLRGADLRSANLTGAFLIHADLRGTNLKEVNLKDANLYSANLNGADLNGADLSEVVLWNADLTNAKVTNEQLSQVNSLKNTTLPNGSICHSEIPTDCLK